MHELLELIVSANLATAAPAEVPSVEIESVWDFVMKGGKMMIPIGLCSIVALTVVFDRIVHLRRGAILPRDLVERVDAACSGSGDGPGRARELCERDRSPLANVLAAALKRTGALRETVTTSVQEAAEREVHRMRRFLRVLAVIASVAPLLGLLGTIFGMIRAFQTVAASAEALGKTEMLVRGIYEAMITTAGGLCVAIPVLICYHWLCSKVQQRLLDIDDVVVDFVDRHHLAVDPAPAPRPIPAVTIEPGANGVESPKADAPAAAGAPT